MLLIYALKNGFQLSVIIFEIMLKEKRLQVYQTPFLFFLSTVFQHYGVDLVGETTTIMRLSNRIEKICLHKMGMVKKR